MTRWRFRVRVFAIAALAAAVVIGVVGRAGSGRLTAAEWKQSIAGRNWCQVSVVWAPGTDVALSGEDAVDSLLADLPAGTQFARDRSGVLEAGGVSLYYGGPPNMMAWVYPDAIVVRDENARMYRSTAANPAFAGLHAKLSALCRPPAAPTAPPGAGP